MQPRGESIIEARGIEKSFRQPEGRTIQVIAPIDLSLEADTVTALLGPSGSGKSTLLRILSGLAAPTAGEVLWHGKPMSQCAPNVAIVFQSFALFPWLTVLENVEAPLLARGMAHHERHRARSARRSQSVGLKGFENAYPKELSGGMKQRVGFARALAVEPEVLFMDEPFSALDVLTAENLRGELMELWLAKKIPTRSIFLVTHNIEEAVLLADRIIVLGRNPARIRADFRVALAAAARSQVRRVSAVRRLHLQGDDAAGARARAALARSAQPAKAAPQMLPHARPGGIAGLLELLVDRGGKEDLYHVAEDLQLEVDDLLPIVEAATLLGFAKAHEGDVEITPDGQGVRRGRHRRRKSTSFAMPRWPMWRSFSRCTRRSKASPTHACRWSSSTICWTSIFPSEDTEQQIETALNWGRYGEIFTYDPETDRLRLHRAGQPEDAAEGSALH